MHIYVEHILEQFSGKREIIFRKRRGERMSFNFISKPFLQWPDDRTLNSEQIFFLKSKIIIQKNENLISPFFKWLFQAKNKLHQVNKKINTFTNHHPINPSDLFTRTDTFLENYWLPLPLLPLFFNLYTIMEIPFPVNEKTHFARNLTFYY